MRKSISIIIFIIFIGGIFNFLDAKSKSAELYFHRGLESYLKGDIEETITNVEEALKFDKENKKMKAFIVKVLAERSSELFLNKQYMDALPYLEKAKWYDPDNVDVNRMYNITYQQLYPVTQPPDVTQPPVVIQIPSRDEEEKENIMITLLAQVQKQQEDLIKAYTYPQDILRQIITKSEGERELLLKVIERTFEAQRKSSYYTVMFSIGGFLVAIILVIFLIYFILMKISAKRERILIDQQTKILDMVQKQSLALAQGATQLRLTYTPAQEEQTTPRQMINDPNPRVRTKGLEVIEAELIEGDENAEVAEKLLVPFIKEKDNRVRATALKIFHHYNPEKAMESIKEMIKSNDRWMRISAVWVLGEVIPDLEIVEVLLSNINDKDYHFKRRVVKALKNILGSDEKKINKKVREKIQNTINDLRYKEHWVI